MTRRLPLVLTLGLVLASALVVPTRTASAQDIPKIVTPVNDLSNVLNDAQEERIASKLVAHRKDTGVQIALLIVGTTGGVPIEDYAVQVAEAWGGGSEKRSDGVLLVLAIQDRRSRIDVGYDLEAKIPDAAARTILDGMKPSLRNGDFAGALDGAVGKLIGRTGGMAPVVAYQPEPIKSRRSSRNQEKDSDSGMGVLIVIVVSIVAIIFLAALFSSSNSSSSWSASSSGSSWGTALDIVGSIAGAVLEASASSSSSSSSWSSSSSSSSFSSSSYSSSSSSSSSTSWGGGGGSFGGGGASSSW